MGINIDKIPGISKIYKNYSVEKEKGIKEVSALQSKKDELTISQKAKDYQVVSKAKKALENIPDIREDKVNEIKQKIDKGIYDIDGKDIAEKMLESKFDRKI